MCSRIRPTNQDTKTAARLKTLEKKACVLKADLLERLAKTPIVIAAINACGIGRSTYYKWRHDDAEFAKSADKAIGSGRTFVNDIALSKLMQRIDEGHLTALIFWLKNNHAWFSEVVRHAHEHTHEHHLSGDGVLTDEMREQIVRATKLTGMVTTLRNHKGAMKKFQGVTNAQTVTDAEDHSSVAYLKKEIQKLSASDSPSRRKLSDKLGTGNKPSVNIANILKHVRDK